MLHLYRVYQLEEVIHENLRPEKSQEDQRAGGKRKSYNPGPDDGEAPGEHMAAAKKSRRKRVKKEVIEVGRSMDAEVDGGSPGRKDANLPTEKPDDSAGGLEREVLSPREGNKKKERNVTNVEGETDDVKVVQKGKKPETAGDTAEPPQIKKRRKRRIGI